MINRPRLVVRLRNWVGDVTLGVPALRRLADSGYELHLVGKGWAADLLAGEGHLMHKLAPSFGGRVRQLLALSKLPALPCKPTPAQHAQAARPLNGLCLPYSFSSALEFRLAGLRALGHRHEGRGLLLGQAVARQARQHALLEYWELAGHLLPAAQRLAPPPERIGLRLTTEHRQQAQVLMQAHGLAPGFILICPFAGGTFEKLDKRWPAFANFANEQLPALGRKVLLCPGPGEETEAQAHYPKALSLPGVGLGALAALCEQAGLMISNDTGPGHLAAAVGVPLVSVLGPTDPAQWRAWGPTVQLLGGNGQWPAVDQVRQAVSQRLRTA